MTQEQMETLRLRVGTLIEERIAWCQEQEKTALTAREIKVAHRWAGSQTGLSMALVIVAKALEEVVEK